MDRIHWVTLARGQSVPSNGAPAADRASGSRAREWQVHTPRLSGKALLASLSTWHVTMRTPLPDQSQIVCGYGRSVGSQADASCGLVSHEREAPAIHDLGMGEQTLLRGDAGKQTLTSSTSPILTEFHRRGLLSHLNQEYNPAFRG
jgi:hypothetical protein